MLMIENLKGFITSCLKLKDVDALILYVLEVTAVYYLRDYFCGILFPQ